MATTFRRKVFYRYLIITVLALVVLFLSIVLSHNRVQSFDKYIVSTPSEIADEYQTVIVFGSAVDNIAKEPRPIVRKRLQAALELYRQEVVTQVIVSGYQDTVSNDYNEPDVMKRFLVTEGVPTSDIIEDARGDSSYDTCLNIKNEFEIDYAVLVTQHTHLPRTLYLCRNMGISAVGYSAEASPSRRWLATQLSREMFSNVKAVFDIRIRYDLLHQD